MLLTFSRVSSREVICFRFQTRLATERCCLYRDQTSELQRHKRDVSCSNDSIALICAASSIRQILYPRECDYNLFAGARFL